MRGGLPKGSDFTDGLRAAENHSCYLPVAERLREVSVSEVDTSWYKTVLSTCLDIYFFQEVPFVLR